MLYTLAIYRLTDVYTRAALGESLAMAILPFFTLALCEVLLGDRNRWPHLALAAGCLLHTHLITSALAALLSGLLSLLLLPRILREGRLFRLILAFLSAALLGLCLAAPMLTFMKQGVSGEDLAKSLAGSAMAPAQLLSQTGYDLGVQPLDTALRAKGYEVGAPLLLSAVFCLSLLLARREHGEKARPGESIAAFFLGLGTICLFLSSTLFPWGALPGPIARAASLLQFPWRLLMFLDLSFALCGAWALTQIQSALYETGSAKEAAGKTFLLAVTLAFCLSSVLPMLTRETRKNKYVLYNRVSEQGMTFFDYSLPGTDSRTMTREIEAQGAEVLSFDRAGTNLSLRLRSESGGQVTLPVFAFDGWEARESGKALTLSRTEFNCLRLMIPAGAGERLVTVRYVGKPSWLAADLVSLGVFLLLLLLLTQKPKRGRSGASLAGRDPPA